MKTTTETQLEAAMQKIKGLLSQIIQATAKDIKALTAADVGAAAANHTHISATSATIQKTGWKSDSTATYPNYYDIAVSGVTASDRASVDIAPAALSTAADCGLCPACETLAGVIRLRAVSVPAAAMAATYWVEKGA
ncbi:MAG: hypothetical protein NC489_39935 [Ruminococcus flavefaciens]|nr:hypothetical protein [Ruminococcus flavefaciens]